MTANGKRIAYLGPRGTYSEEAALLYDPSGQLLAMTNIPAIAAAVETGMADEGVVPIENSIEGSVIPTVDLLIHESPLVIRHELVLPIHAYLVARPGTKATDVKVLYSHPQPLGQCRKFLDRCFPKVEVVAALSTTAAVEEMMASDKPAAALGPKRAAELYGAAILASRVEDQATNVTRFVVLAQTDHPPTGADRTSLCFAFAEDRAGVLVDVLHEFADRGINLSKLESRPTKASLGEYIFLADLEGHRLDPSVAAALAGVRAKTALFKVFGSYPRYRT